MRRFLSILAAVLLPTSASCALEIAGVEVPEQKKIEGQNLSLNGAGIRTVSIFNIRVYVAALYLPREARRPIEILNSPKPIAMDFTFVRAVDEKKADEAWVYQFKESVSDPYGGLEGDLQKLTGFFGPIKKFGVQSFLLLDDKTQTFENGKLKGSIPGTDFQKAFLNIWMGPRPPTEALKNALLGAQSK